MELRNLRSCLGEAQKMNNRKTTWIKNPHCASFVTFVVIGMNKKGEADFKKNFIS